MKIKELFLQNIKSILYLLTTLVLPISVSSYLSVYIIKNEQLFQNFTFNEWAIIFVISSFTMALALTPTTFIAMVCGYFLGFKCIPWLVLSYTFASIIGFLLAKTIGGKSLKESISTNPNLGIIVNGIKEYEYSVIFLTRISPILPFALINGVLGILGCNIRKFILAGTLGMLPRTLLFIYIGNEVGNLIDMFKNGKSMSISQISFYILLAISILGIFWIIGNIAKKLKAKIQ